MRSFYALIALLEFHTLGQPSFLESFPYNFVSVTKAASVEHRIISLLYIQHIAGNFSLHHHVRNGSGAHPASYPMGIRGSFPGGKEAGA
jgi:hypothetical protein